jgi:hypothetical protein
VNERPHYFDEIRERAARRWDQLESDPELAGPWHQLFKQVQSPRHILSELLQNADDAGATEATVRIEDHCFVFTHDGEDFSEEHFASLCRFGYSNKRALHTIGFRGIGFKSTFSLGDTVRLLTPTLSVAFGRQRFTEPKWLNGAALLSRYTEVHVPIADAHREREVEKNLKEWLKSPVSLLFFKHIRRLRIGKHEMHWGSMGPGPVPDTEWMALHQNPDDAFLVARSADEAFPADALSEIRQERLLGADQEEDFPACKVEIVLGAKGRLYVVLPTGVETSLPFACNAPFIQDPARLKIKDPETSPTNRWLLERVGSLAASVTLKWLQAPNASLVERSRAYALFPDVDRDDNTLEGTCATTVEETFDDAIDGHCFLLTNEGELRPSGQSVIFPEEMFDVWPAKQVASLLDSASRPPLSRHVSGSDRDKLVRWGVVDHVSKEDVLTALEAKHLPRPETWRRLLKLWAYVAPDITGWRMTTNCSKLRVLPAHGKNVLYSAAEVVRLGEKRLLQSEEDWEFLSAHLLVLNQNWTRFITEQRRTTESAEDVELHQEAAAAQAVLKTLGLEESSDVSKIIDQVAAGFYNEKSKTLANYVQLAQIAAKLGASAGESFRFASTDLRLRSRAHVVLFCRDGTLEALLPKLWSTEHLLHPEYSKNFKSCTAGEWQRWITSGHSGLLEFPPLRQKRVDLYGRQKIEAELRRRGSSSAPTFQYKTSSFILADWDFEDVFWNQWTAAARNDARIWERVLVRVFAQPESYWSSATSARALHVATTGSARAISSDELLPAWILKFRDLPCLPDTRGFLRKPTELLRRTPETESLIDVEFFVHGLLDREMTRPLLALLGVRDTPTGPDRLLDCLRALALSSKPPIQEVEKWYRRLDHMVDTCSTDDLLNIKKAFWNEKIILTEGACWATLSGVYLSSDEDDVPGAAIIRESVRELALWRKIGVAEQPTADLAIQWLKQLPVDKPLSQDDARRVRALMPRHACRIWHECGQWLNLAREWVSVTNLEYALTMQTLTEYSHLHEWVKQQTADFQRLPAEITDTLPFADLPRLASVIEERLQKDPLLSATPEKQLWLTQLGVELSRIELDDSAEAQRVRTCAEDLAHTAWRTTATLEIIPYIDGAPAGTPKRAEVVWFDRTLFVEKLPQAKLARLVPERLGKVFGRTDVTAALNYCFGRSADDVTEYMEENFKLRPRAASAAEKSETPISEAQLTPRAGEALNPDSATPPETSSDEASAGPTVIAEPTTAIDVEPTDHPNEPQGETDVRDVEPPRDRPFPKPAKPSIIERFARSFGYQKESDERFFHADGSWIGKAHDDRFPWERRTAKGELVHRYWPKDHCLEQQPLQLEADIWGLMDKFPDVYALILSTPHGDAIEMPGARLCAMRDEGELTLYPATYRLVLDHDR